MSTVAIAAADVRPITDGELDAINGGHPAIIAALILAPFAGYGAFSLGQDISRMISSPEVLVPNLFP